MKKSQVNGSIVVMLIAVIIMSGYRYHNRCHDIRKNMDTIYEENSICNIKVVNKAETNKKIYEVEKEYKTDKDFLIITGDKENEAVDKLADIMDADICKVLGNDNNVKISDDIDMSQYSMCFVNLSSPDENCIDKLKQLSDEYYLDGKTIIPIYDSETTVFEEICELEERSCDSVWLTGGTLENNASQEEVKSWVKGLGMYIVNEVRCKR